MSITPRWSPSVTVAAVVEHRGRFLLVEERTPEGLRLNNPAGHLEPGESPLEGCVREVREETARDFHASAFLGVYLGRFARGPQTVSYLRLAFVGTVGDERPELGGYDREIVRTLWLDAGEIEARRADWRSPLVGRCIADARAGRRLPLEAVTTDPSVYMLLPAAAAQGA
jgi:8-oxo-dGTP pyrophosphatase MutT (NUDIX family)